MNGRSQTKYLRRLRFKPDYLLAKNYDYYVVIPARKEKALFPETLQSVLQASALVQKKGEDVCVIVVVNSPENPSQSEVIQNQFVSDYCEGFEQVFVLERFSSKYLTRGVGEARKLGMDHAVFWSKENPWFISLDADTTIDAEYFLQLSLEKSPVVLANFQHRLLDHYSEDHKKAVEEYDAWLRYFAKGLQYARSPYAYVPLGSRFALRKKAYIQVGGMVRRKAGEDFHFLQKLTKLQLPKKFGRIDASVYPSGRLSDRVPWGTGPAVIEIQNQEKSYQNVENPEAFGQLRDFLAGFGFLYDEDIKIAKELKAFLGPEYESVVNKIRKNSKHIEQFTKQMHVWFDGLASIRFINSFTREHGKVDIDLAYQYFLQKPGP